MPRKRKSRKPPAQSNSLFLLDQFSESDLRTWKRKSQLLDSYHIGVYHHLEGLRQLHNDALCDALREAGATAHYPREWVRIIDYQYSLVPLSVEGSYLSGGRFNIGNNLDPSRFPPLPALYLADRLATAYSERFGRVPDRNSDLQGHELALRNPGSFTQVRISGHIPTLFDLRRRDNLNQFVKIIRKFDLPDELKRVARELSIRPPLIVNTNKRLQDSMLVSNWRAWPMQPGIPANPQIFGRLLVKAGFEGVIYPSSKTEGTCIAVFPQNFTPGDSYLEIADPSPTEVAIKRLDHETYSEVMAPRLPVH